MQKKAVLHAFITEGKLGENIELNSPVFDSVINSDINHTRRNFYSTKQMEIKGWKTKNAVSRGTVYFMWKSCAIQ